MKNFIVSLITALLASFVFMAIAFTWLKFDLANVQDRISTLETTVSSLPQPKQNPGGIQNAGNANINVNTNSLTNSSTNNVNSNPGNVNGPLSPQGDQGPTNHNVYVTTPSDPSAFVDSDTPVFEKASVPDAVRLHTASAAGEVGDMLMYFPSFENFAGNGSERIAYSRSTDNGLTWSTRQSATITDQLNAGAAVDPSLVQLDDGRLRMYFFGSETTTGDPASVAGDHVMYSAISDDGVNFTVEPGERLALEKITDPEVIEFNNQWIMYVAEGRTTLIATSDNGLDFTLTDSIWPEGGIPGAYVDAENVVHLYGCGKGGIVTQTSTDGVTFAKAGAKQVLGSDSQEIVCDPSPVLVENGDVVMVYKKAAGGGLQEPKPQP